MEMEEELTPNSQGENRLKSKVDTNVLEVGEPFRFSAMSNALAQLQPTWINTLSILRSTHWFCFTSIERLEKILNLGHCG